MTSHSLKIWENHRPATKGKGVPLGATVWFYSPRSTSRTILALRQLMPKYRKARKGCIVCSEKACGRVPRVEVWSCLLRKEVNEKYIRLIQDRYLNSKTRVRCAAGTSDDFEITVGLYQGSALGPFLFAILICLTGNIQKESP